MTCKGGLPVLLVPRPYRAVPVDPARRRLRPTKARALETLPEVRGTSAHFLLPSGGMSSPDRPLPALVRALVVLVGLLWGSGAWANPGFDLDGIFHVKYPNGISTFNPVTRSASAIGDERLLYLGDARVLHGPLARQALTSRIDGPMYMLGHHGLPGGLVQLTIFEATGGALPPALLSETPIWGHALEVSRGGRYGGFFLGSCWGGMSSASVMTQATATGLEQVTQIQRAQGAVLAEATGRAVGALPAPVSAFRQSSDGMWNFRTTARESTLDLVAEYRAPGTSSTRRQEIVHLLRELSRFRVAEKASIARGEGAIYQRFLPDGGMEYRPFNVDFPDAGLRLVPEQHWGGVIEADRIRNPVHGVDARPPAAAAPPSEVAPIRLRARYRGR